VFLHVAAVLFTPTKDTSASVGTLRINCSSDVLNLVVECREDECDRHLRLKLGWASKRRCVWAVGLRSDEHVHSLWGYGVDVTLVDTAQGIDVAKHFIVSQ